MQKSHFFILIKSLKMFLPGIRTKQLVGTIKRSFQLNNCICVSEKVQLLLYLQGRLIGKIYIEIDYSKKSRHQSGKQA